MRIGGRALAVAALVWSLAAPPAASPQVAPPDTFADPGARALVLRAAAGRNRVAEGLASYEATVTERMRIGIQFGRRGIAPAAYEERDTHQPQDQ